MNVLIETKSYDISFLKTATGFFELFFMMEWKRFISVGTQFLVDKKTLNKMLDYCKNDKYNYFNGYENIKEDIVENLTKILLVFSKNEKAIIRFS